jgi:hypothetical protein
MNVSGAVQIFRPDPAAPAQAYKTYELSAPLATHHRPATCKEVNCPRYANGWLMKFDPNTDLGREQLGYIRMHSGRHYVDMTVIGEQLVTLRFAPGQDCFTAHTVPLDREPNYRVRGGDFRANTGLIRAHTNGADWVDDFATHQDMVKTRVERG